MELNDKKLLIELKLIKSLNIMGGTGCCSAADEVVKKNPHEYDSSGG